MAKDREQKDKLHGHSKARPAELGTTRQASRSSKKPTKRPRPRPSVRASTSKKSGAGGSLPDGTNGATRGAGGAPGRSPAIEAAGASGEAADAQFPSARAHSRSRALALVAVAAAVVIFAAVAAWQLAAPITVTVNDVDVRISQRTVQAAFEAADEPASAGDLYDIEGALLKEGGGEDIVVTVNGEAADFDDALKAGDVLVFTDGGDAEEPSTLGYQTIEPPIEEDGAGPIFSIVQEGEAGLAAVQYGEVSGKSIVLEVIKPAVARVYERWTPDVGDDKVIALTFDDGPSDEYTAEVLDVLAEYGVTATFFTIGRRVATETGAELVQRAAAEGHQICTHTWDHAAGNGRGVNLSYMTAEEQREEVSLGIEAVAEATGGEASTVIRAPGGNFPLEVWQNVEDLISAQVTWTVDTKDWTEPGVDAIVEELESVQPGDIVLLHDGGGDRSQTVEALEIALPYLIEEGYRFVTIDELMEYPAAK